MPRGRPKQPWHLEPELRQQLEALARSRTLPHGLVHRVRLVLMAADGLNNREIAARLGLSQATVGKWRRRFLERGLPGLHDELRPGRPRSISDEQVADLIQRTLQTPPPDGDHWSCRSLAAAGEVSKSTVHRLWRACALQPHLFQYFQLSTDPFFVEKVRDVVGLYLDPPAKALVLCVDEKSQCPALERTQPALPLGWGYLEGFTHTYARQGTVTLFAALDVATGQVLTHCRKRHRHPEFLEFLRHIEAAVPPDLDVHLILDNYATHKHQKVRLWLAQHPRYHVHFTPTYASWLNQVETWFSLLTRKALRRSSFQSTQALVHKMDAFVQAHNQDSAPFSWTASADSILRKLGRLCEKICGTDH